MGFSVALITKISEGFTATSLIFTKSLRVEGTIILLYTLGA